MSRTDPNPRQDIPPGSQGGGIEWLSEHRKGKAEEVSYDEVVRTEEFTPWQIKKAAWLVRKHAEYREKISR
jgi:carnitine O-acetyltransferase